MAGPTALIRPVPDSFQRALVREGRPQLDVPAARAQHQRYRQHLEESEYSIEVVPPDEDQPDCVFIEDTAIVIREVALITRPGAPSRRDETGPVAEVLRTRFPVVEVVAPGTIDGGDVFLTPEVVYVGKSSRTNEAGIDQLRSLTLDLGMSLVVVEVHEGLHLKSAVLPIDPETVVVTPQSVDETALDALHIVYEADVERHRFSALPLRDGRILVTADAPATAGAVSALGHEVVPIDVSQIQAADGGLTCMSILL
ncbi:MAG TPA: arginine deiminase family protein [Acidimicrobiia bacterium]|nr:arginine deiminase family protein [Acidimicrobiia bacterium]